MASHWNPYFKSIPQNPDSIQSMTAHCVLQQLPEEEKLLSKDNFLELWAEHCAQIEKDWSEIFSKIVILNKMYWFHTYLFIKIYSPCRGRKLKKSIISAIITRFWPNFKGRFLETFRTDFKCHSDICPGNICPGDICRYQPYLSCYWPDLDQTLNKGSWEHIQQITTVTTTFVHGDICPYQQYKHFQVEHFRLQSCNLL